MRISICIGGCCTGQQYDPSGARTTTDFQNEGQNDSRCLLCADLGERHHCFGYPKIRQHPLSGASPRHWMLDNSDSPAPPMNTAVVCPGGIPQRTWAFGLMICSDNLNGRHLARCSTEGVKVHRRPLSTPLLHCLPWDRASAVTTRRGCSDKPLKSC